MKRPIEQSSTNRHTRCLESLTADCQGWLARRPGWLTRPLLHLAVSALLLVQTSGAEEYTFTTLAGPPEGGPGAIDGPGSTVRVGVRACADRPVADLDLAPVAVTRRLDTLPHTATAWQWTCIRLPAASSAELSCTTACNPTFTPDVAGLYVFRLLATNPVTGEASLRTLPLTAVPANVGVIVLPQRLPDGSFWLTLVGQTNQTYTLQVSADLSAWTDWTNVSPVSFSTPLTDPAAAHEPQRFYRARTR